MTLFYPITGRMAVHSGKRGEQGDNQWRLFVVRGEKEQEAHLLQVNRSVEALRSRGCLLLVNRSTGIVYVWLGSKSLKHTRQVASAAASALKESTPPEMGFQVSGYFMETLPLITLHAFHNRRPSRSRSSTRERSRGISGKDLAIRVEWRTGRCTIHSPSATSASTSLRASFISPRGRATSGRKRSHRTSIRCNSRARIRSFRYSRVSFHSLFVFIAHLQKQNKTGGLVRGEPAGAVLVGQ